jgi:hypothetical protein
MQASTPSSKVKSKNACTSFTHGFDRFAMPDPVRGARDRIPSGA